MIQQMSYGSSHEAIYQNEDVQQQINNQTVYQQEQKNNELKNSSKKATYQLKFMKQLKSRDIKLRLLSHKKIQIYPSKTPFMNNISSVQNEKQPMEEENNIQNRIYPSQQLKRNKKHRNNQVQQNHRDKQRIAVEVISNFNPELLSMSKQTSPFMREKYQRKSKVSEPPNLQNRIRQSRSENKRQKNTNAHINLNTQKNHLKKQIVSHDHDANIFQSLQLIAKQNSYNSLQKNNHLYSNGMYKGNSKIQEKLHLPSLVGSSGLKHIKNKIYQNTNTAQEANQLQADRQMFYGQQGISSTQKSTPYIQKIVKIPIDRLKPLKPEQIKLKYQKKVKQQQKNRAKQRALQIFSKQQEQYQKTKKLSLNDDYDILQSDENTPQQIRIRRLQSQEPIQFRNKVSIIKKQKLFPTSKNQNIFKKHLLAYNANVQHC